MIFLLISIFVPLTVYMALPELLSKLSLKGSASTRLLGFAGFAFFLSWYLPSPLIYGEDTSFTTHFLGGGVFTGFVWLYIKQRAMLRMSILAELVSLYVLVSALGVANELFELLVVQLKLVNLHPSDTWWDLLANSLGALAFWLGYRIVRAAKK
jgi:hypothetical protein